jgi:hypothetical protein
MTSETVCHEKDHTHCLKLEKECAIRIVATNAELLKMLKELRERMTFSSELDERIGRIIDKAESLNRQLSDG